MSFEDLQALKQAKWAIEKLAGSLGVDISELDEVYDNVHKNLEELIDRWETKA